MSVPSTRERAAPLTAAQREDVLRYWLAAVRLEETLKVRPRARRTQHSTQVPRLDAPAAGQEYFKLPLDELVAKLLGERQSVRRAFDGELSAFFEGWLLNQYRRGQDENELSHLLCFPVVHLPRGELAGLLRLGVRLRFASGESQAFRTPSRAERARGSYPPAPDEVRITTAPRNENVWPFFLDTRLLSYPLGLSSEEIDALFEALRAAERLDEQQMLSLVTRALEKAAGEAEGPREAELGALLTRLRLAMHKLLRQGHSRAQVYPVGVVIDGTSAKTTWHLQRELVSLIEGEEKEALAHDTCLAAYLGAGPVASLERPQRALFSGPSLTTYQRRAAESFWGSPLTAVQGPPGTGKTTLILHLCAEALVRRVDSLLDRGAMSSELMLITSGNNRAVDNVMDPLASGAGLPLGLRVGSRQVCEQTLSGQLQRAASWLARAEAEPDGVRADALAQELARFGTLRAELAALLAPRLEAIRRTTERERVTRELAALGAPPPLTSVRDGAKPPALSRNLARALGDVLPKLEERMKALSALCGQKPGMPQINAVARHFGRTAKRDLPALEAVLDGAGMAFEWPLPPLQTPVDVKALMEVWEEGAESFLEQLAELRERVDVTLRADEHARKRDKLETELATLGVQGDETMPPEVEHDELSRALFLAAVDVREAWARVHAKELRDAVETAHKTVERERSLRPLFRDEPERATLLCRLFGVWGSTLLSLGNCLPAEAGESMRVVIDEAGQCHPAHAVSALLRCQAAMIVGDVFQLTPVIDLSADDEARLLRSTRLRIGPAALAPFRVHADSQVSVQSVADRAVQTRHTLIDHFRCQPEIIAISNALCGYGLTVHTRRADASETASLSSLLPFPVLLIDLQGEQERVAGSLCNALELRATMSLLEELFARGVRPQEIAIITPYRGQLELLRRALIERRVPLELSAELGESEGPALHREPGLALGTVHRFQGGERSIVLFSSVITQQGSLPFLNARPNLLNVAVSRAQRHFVCLGDRRTLALGPKTRLLVDAAVPLTLTA